MAYVVARSVAVGVGGGLRATAGRRSHGMAGLGSAVHGLRAPLRAPIRGIERGLDLKLKRGIHNSYRRNGMMSEDQLLYGLIGSNVAVWAMWQTVSPYTMYKHFTCSSDGILTHHRWHTLATCFFSHESGWHLAGNMLGLYFFGGELIAFLGARTFFTMYIGAGLVSSAAQVAQSYYNRQRTVLYGASGAVNACIAYSILQWPKRLVMIYGIIPMPAAIFGVFIMFQDVWGAMDSMGGIKIRGATQVGYVSHLVGAGIGAAFWAATRRRFRRF